MARNNKYVLNLEIDTKTAEKQIRDSVKRIDNLVSSIGGSGGNNLTYFKELFGYMAQLDQQITDFKQKNGDMFNQIFGDLDVNVKKQLESAFGATKEQLITIGKLKGKIDSLGGIETTTKEDLQPIEKEIKELYKAMGLLDKLEVTGKGKIETRIKKIQEAIDSLIINFADADKKIGEGINLGRINIDDGVVEDAKNLNKNLKKEVEKIKLLTYDIKKGIEDFYDAILDGSTGDKLNSVKKRIQKAWKLNDEDFLKFDDVFTGLEDGSLEEDEAFEKVQNKIKEINELKEANAKIVEKKAKTKVAKAKKKEAKENQKQTPDSPAPEQINKEIDETAAAIEYGKKKITTAWKNYYKAVRDAMNDGVDVESGRTTSQMNSVMVDIESMLDKWGLSVKQKFNLGGLSESIQDGDIKFGDIEGEINKMFDDLDIKPSIPLSEINAETETVENNVEELENSVKDSFDAMSSEAEQLENSIESATDAFQELISYISKSGSGNSPGKFFANIINGSQEVDGELYGILEKLKLMDQFGNVNFSAINSGFTNKGGIISDDHVLIAREESKIKYALESQPKTLMAKEMGANVGAILEIYKDEANKIIYELQNKVKGEEIIDFKKGIVNTDFLEATDEQVEKLINDLLILQKTGIYIDHNGSNILYDKNEGFSFIDVASKPAYFTASTENSVEENLDLFLKQAFSKGLSPDKASNFTDKVYSIAGQIIGNGATKTAAQSKTAQDSTKKVASSIKTETSVHEQNTAAINAENKALQAQIKLKEKAQNMTWHDFAVDDSLNQLKVDSGLSTLGDVENFWKKARYEKNIDYKALSEEEADDIINSYISKKLQYAWYVSQDFPSKTIIENTTLGNDELKNAAINKMWHYWNKYSVEANKNGTLSFEDFINKEFTLYRGDDGPMIYSEGEGLSFSFDKGTGENFDSHIETIKAKPIELLGNLDAYNTHGNEVEIIVPSNKLPNNEDSLYVSGKHKSFADYYNSQTKSMQNIIDIRLIEREKQRLEGILSEDLLSNFKNIGKDHGRIKYNFSESDVPYKLDYMGSDDLYDQFAKEYNMSTNMQKNMLAYYISLLDKSEDFSNLPNPKMTGKNGISTFIGQTGFMDALMTDKLGAKQHLANLTEEYKFNFLGEEAQKINEANAVVAASYKNYEDELKKVDQAQSSKDIVEQYKTKALDMYQGILYSDLLGSLKDIEYTQSHGDDELLKSGKYIHKEYGDKNEVNLDYIIGLISDIEHQYGDNLDVVKEHLQNVFENADINRMVEISKSKAASSINNLDNFDDDDLLLELVEDELLKEATSDKTLSIKEAYDKLDSYMMSDDVDLEEFDKLKPIYKTLTNIKAFTDSDFISSGEISDVMGTGIFDVKSFISKIESIEQEIGVDLGYVKNAVYDLYKDYFNGLEDALDTPESLITENKAKKLSSYDVSSKLAKISTQAILDGKSNKFDDFTAIFDAIESVGQSFPSDIENGEYMHQKTGEILSAKDLLDYVKAVEVKYSENLDYVKEYLNQVYNNLDDVGNITENPHDKVVKKLKDLLFNINDDSEASAIEKLMTIVDNLHNGKDSVDVSDLLSAIEKIEHIYGENLDYVKDYVNQLYGNLEQNEIFVEKAHNNLDTNQFKSMHEKLYNYIQENMLSLSDTHFEELDILFKGFEDVYKTPKDLLDSGKFKSSVDGGTYNLNTILSLVKELEDVFGDNLDYVKDYLNDALGVNEATLQKAVLEQSFMDTESMLKGKIAHKYSMGYDTGTLEGILSDLSDVNYTVSEQDHLIQDKYYKNEIDGTVNDIIAIVQKIQAAEQEYNESFDYIYDYLQDVYGNFSTVDLVNSNLLNKAKKKLNQEMFNHISDDDFDLGNGLVDIYKEIQSVGYTYDNNYLQDIKNGEYVDHETGEIKRYAELSDMISDFESKYNKDLSYVYDYLNNIFAEYNAEIDKFLSGKDIKAPKSSIDHNDVDNEILHTDEKLSIVDSNDNIASDQKFGDYALETTLQVTNDILNNISKAIGENEKEDDSLDKAVTSLGEAVTEMKNASNGIIEHQKKQVKTLESSKRIDTSEKRAYMSGIAAQALSGDVNNVDIDKIYAAADGLVGISGAVKNAEGVWEGFSLHISEANEAIDVSINKHSTYAKKLNETADAVIKAETKKKVATKGVNIGNAQSKYNVVTHKAQDYIGDGSTLFSKEIQERVNGYTEALKNLYEIKEKLDNTSKDDSGYNELAASFDVAKDKCKELGNEINKTIDEYNKFKSKSDESEDLNIGDYDLASIEGRKEALKDFVEAAYYGSVKIKDFNEDCTELNFTFKNSDGVVQNMTASFNKLQTSIGATASKATAAENSLRGFIAGIKKETGKLLSYFTARVGIEEFFQAFRTGFQYVKEIDAALTELKKVTNETDATYDRFLQTASKTAGVIGSTVSEITTMSAEWARLGYSIEESAKLAESTAVLLNVSEFDDATEASEALISTMQAFGYVADDSQHVVDILNEVKLLASLYSNVY